MFAPDDLWFGLVTYKNCAILYRVIFRCLNVGVCYLHIDALLMGGEMASGGLPFRDIGCPVSDVGYIYVA